MNVFNGTAVALVTPFDSQNLIDVQALKALVRKNINAGMDYLVVLGTTAETATLSEIDQELVIQTVINENNGAVPLVLGMGGNNTLELVNKIKKTDLTHFAAILSVTPYYNKPTQEGIIAHFNAVADASPIPVIIYNVPSRTGVNMLPATSLSIAKNNSNVIGIKEACGDLEQIAALLKGKEADFLVISGDDATAYETTLAGGAGVISVIGQALPEIFISLIKSAQLGKNPNMFSYNKDLQPIISTIFKEGNPAGIKGLLSLVADFPIGVRLPLLPASNLLLEQLSKDLKDLKSLKETMAY